MFPLPPIHLSDTAEQRIAFLTERLDAYHEFAVAHEQLEADMLTDGGSWVDAALEMYGPAIEIVQGLRNKALGR